MLTAFLPLFPRPPRPAIGIRMRWAYKQQGVCLRPTRQAKIKFVNQAVSGIVACPALQQGLALRRLARVQASVGQRLAAAGGILSGSSIERWYEGHW